MEPIEDFVEDATRHHGLSFDPASLRPTSQASKIGKIADATYSYYLKKTGSDDAFVIIIANEEFPSTVKEASDKARLVAATLSPGTAHHVLMPVVEGLYAGQTYAVFPQYTASSANRILRTMRRARFSGRICSWLGDVGQQSRQDCGSSLAREQSFTRPLTALAQETEMPSGIRDFSRYCLSAISDGSVDLFTVVEHGDFWSGNIVYDDVGFFPMISSGDFFVIDWRGSRLDGYAGIDIVRYGISSYGTKNRGAGKLLKMYKAAMNISDLQLSLFCMASMGRLGMNLDQFPKGRYIKLVESVFGFLKAHEQVPAK